MNLPQVFQEAITKTAASMQATFKHVGSLNGHRNAPMPERNTVVHFAASLINAGFAVYAEPSLPEKGGRVDLLASNKDFTFVCEVKTFGRLKLDRLLNDAQRLAAYEPQIDPPIAQIDPMAFWSQTEKWGAILVQGFVGQEFNDLWCWQVSAPKEFESKLKAYEFLDVQRKTDFTELAKFLQSRHAYTSNELICKDIWADDVERLDLLWAAFTL